MNAQAQPDIPAGNDADQPIPLVAPLQQRWARLDPTAPATTGPLPPRPLDEPTEQPDTTSDEIPLWRRASLDFLALVVDVDIDVLTGRPVDKGRALVALAARQELADRMRRHLWLSTETARASGATWTEIDTALASPPGAARQEHEATLAHQKQLGLAALDRRDPGLPEGPDL